MNIFHSSAGVHDAGSLRGLFTGARSPELVTTAVNALIRTGPSQRIVQTIIVETKGLDAEVLGYVVFPSLRKHLREDASLRDGFFDVLAKGLGSREFRVILIDFLDDAMRHGVPATDPTPLLLRVALAPRQGALVRARAARALIRTRGPGITACFQRLLRERDPVLIDVAAHALVERRRKWPREQASLAAALRFARARPREALRCSGILRAIAASDGATARSLARALAREVRTPADALRLRTAVGHLLDRTSLAALALIDPLAEQVAELRLEPESPARLALANGSGYLPNELRDELERAAAGRTR